MWQLFLLHKRCNYYKICYHLFHGRMQLSLNLSSIGAFVYKNFKSTTVFLKCWKKFVWKKLVKHVPGQSSQRKENDVEVNVSSL